MSRFGSIAWALAVSFCLSTLVWVLTAVVLVLLNPLSDGAPTWILTVVTLVCWPLLYQAHRDYVNKEIN